VKDEQGILSAHRLQPSGSIDQNNCRTIQGIIIQKRGLSNVQNMVTAQPIKWGYKTSTTP
jgi:hypothetical protein